MKVEEMKLITEVIALSGKEKQEGGKAMEKESSPREAKESNIEKRINISQLPLIEFVNDRALNLLSTNPRLPRTIQDWLSKGLRRWLNADIVFCLPTDEIRKAEGLRKIFAEILQELTDRDGWVPQSIEHLIRLAGIARLSRSELHLRQLLFDPQMPTYTTPKGISEYRWQIVIKGR